MFSSRGFYVTLRRKAASAFQMALKGKTVFFVSDISNLKLSDPSFKIKWIEVEFL